MKHPRKKSARKKLPRLRSYGKIEFWVDLHHRRRAVMVECDDPNYPVIAALLFTTVSQQVECQARAKRLLKRIQDHRVDYRYMSKRIPEWARWNRDYGASYVKSNLVDESML